MKDNQIAASYMRAAANAYFGLADKLRHQADCYMLIDNTGGLALTSKDGEVVPTLIWEGMTFYTRQLAQSHQLLHGGTYKIVTVPQAVKAGLKWLSKHNGAIASMIE